MKIHHFLLAALLGSCLALSATQLFTIDFDDYTTDAHNATGVIKSSGLASKDLQLRMFPGPDGKGNSFCYAISERINYPAYGNIQMPQGTLALWFCPVNYDFGNTEQFSIMSYGSGSNDKASGMSRIWVLKSNWGPYIIISHTWKLPDSEKFISRQVQMMVDPKEWGNGKWHHLAVTWDKDAMHLYIDGVEPQRPEKIGAPRYYNNKPAPPDVPCREKPIVGEIPAPEKTSRIYIGDIFNGRYLNEGKGFRNAVDDIQIHDRPLAAKEIRALYEKYRPAQAEIPKENLTSVPKGPVATRVYLKTPMGAPSTKIEAYATTRRDDTNLYVTFHADFPFAVKTQTKRDGTLWEDDSFELHLVSPDKQNIQFIVNGNGAIYDAKNLDVAWSPAGVTAQTTISANATDASLVIPLSELPALPGTWKADFCLTRHIGTKNDYYRWSPVIFDNKFSATSELIFLDKPWSVLPEMKPGLTTGKLHITKNASDGVQCEGSYSVDGQSPIVCGSNVPVWESTLPAGKVQLRLNARAGKQEIYRFTHNCDIEYPMELTFNTMTRENRLTVELNFANSGEEFLKKIQTSGIAGQVRLLGPDGRELVKQPFQCKTSRHAVLLSLPATMPSGDGTIEATAENLRREITYRIPEELPAFTLHLGDDHTVPTPWFPVKVLDTKRIEVLDRIYTFDGQSPLPVSITVKGEEILKKPVVMTLNGTPLTWSNFAIGEKQDDRVIITADASADNAKLTFKGELWFDGMYRMRYTLNAGAVSDFRISTAVVKEHALFAMNPYLVPWKNKVATVSVNIRHAGSGYHTSILWLTGHEKGICLYTASTANWFNKPGTEALRAVQLDDAVSLEGIMIDKTAPAVKNATYDLVLQATPPRRPAKDFRRFNFCSYGKSEEVRHEFNENTGPGALTSFGGVLPKYPDKYDFQWPGRSCPIYHYTLPGHLSNTEHVFDYFDKRLRNMPGTTHSGTEFGQPWMSWQYCTNAGQEIADLYCYWTDKLMAAHRRCGGLYFDVASVRTCENEEHGCAGTDAFGQKFVSNDAMGLRNFFLRVYRVIKKYDGNVILHCHVAFIPFVHDFIDSFAPGENTYRQVVKNLWYPYTEEIPPEIYQSELNWRKAGVPYAMILQQGRACDLMPKYKEFRKEIYGNPEYAIRSLSAMIVHDLNVWGHCVNRGPIDKLWKIFREVSIDDVIDYHGYWVSDAVRSTSKNVYCGWYEWPLERRDLPYARILIISNFNRDKVKANVEIDWKKLGVKEPIIVDDIWNRQRIELKNLKNITIPGAHFLLIGIR